MRNEVKERDKEKETEEIREQQQKEIKGGRRR